MSVPDIRGVRKVYGGHGAPAVTLGERQMYVDIDTGDIYIGDGTVNRINCANSTKTWYGMAKRAAEVYTMTPYLNETGKTPTLSKVSTGLYKIVFSPRTANNKIILPGLNFNFANLNLESFMPIYDLSADPPYVVHSYLGIYLLADGIYDDVYIQTLNTSFNPTDRNFELLLEMKIID